MFTQLKSFAVIASVMPVFVFGFAAPAHAGSNEAVGAYSSSHAHAQAVRGAAYAAAGACGQTGYAQANERVGVVYVTKTQWLRPWPGDTRRVRPRVPVYADAKNHHDHRADHSRASAPRVIYHKPISHADEHYRYLSLHDRRVLRHHPRTNIVLRSSGRHHDVSWRYSSGGRHGHHKSGSGVTIQLRF